jgi:hypothetical protein
MSPRKRRASFGPLKRLRMKHYGYQYEPVVNHTFNTLVRVDTPNVTFINCWFKGPREEKA